MGPRLRSYEARPYWRRHLGGFVYVFLLCCMFAGIVAWNNRTMYEQVTPIQALQQAFAKSPPEPILDHGEHQETISLKSADTTTANATFSPDDVLIMFKTGASTMWHRAPMHLATTLANRTLTPHIAFYSDLAGTIGGHPVVDVLANASAKLKASPDFEYWHLLRRSVRDYNTYVDGEDRDAPALVGGWRLDKYKFLPLAAHAAATFPDKKWYVFVEDDTFFFLEPFLAWLARGFDWRDPVLVGGPASRLGEDFVHGGSGFALSQGAMRRSFLADPRLADKWDDYSLEQGCGDHILSHVLATKGVHRARNEKDEMPLQAYGLRDLNVAKWNWCSPLFTLHHVHQSDVSALYEWEQKFRARKGRGVAPRYSDVFREFIGPHIDQEVREDWDNGADWRHFAAKEEIERGENLSEDERRQRPWFSADACREACRSEKVCMMWKYSDDNCYLSDVVKRGHRFSSEMRVKSGWMLDRIRTLENLGCE